MHNDRCAAVAERFTSGSVLGIELFATSSVYDWQGTGPVGFQKVTLELGQVRSPWFVRAWRIARACWKRNVRWVFFCHYERAEIFLAALLLRISFVRTFLMNDSKFDDYPRRLAREVGKAILHLPYHGGIAASPRSADYMRFLGGEKRRIELGYDAISLERVRSSAETAARCHFEERDFLIVARLVPKKNISVAIEAFQIFCSEDGENRRLHICGSGRLEQELKAQVRAADLSDRVIFHGFEQSDQIAVRMQRSLALLVPSFEEQFGIVIAEATAVGLPVIASTNCGATDELIRSGVNGFIVEHDNPTGIAFFMRLLSNSEALWKRLSEGATRSQSLADVDRFVASTLSLCSWR